MFLLFINIKQFIFNRVLFIFFIFDHIKYIFFKMVYIQFLIILVFIMQPLFESNFVQALNIHHLMFVMFDLPFYIMMMIVHLVLLFDLDIVVKRMLLFDSLVEYSFVLQLEIVL